MRKVLIVGSAALVALCGSAVADTVTNITFDNFCDGMQIQTSDGQTFTSTETGDCLQGVAVTGTGSITGINVKGRIKLISATHSLMLVVDWSAFDGHAAGTDLRRYKIQYPLKTGGSFTEAVYKNGNYTPLNSGTYAVQQ